MKVLFSPDQILFDLPFKHKGIMCAPFIGPVSIRQYLTAGQIEQVICGGENYDGARPCTTWFGTKSIITLRPAL